jgi:hypothetical protein
MPDSKNRVVEFGGVQWIATRPRILVVLRDIKFCQSFGLLVELCGTESELIAAEVATAEIFHGARKYGERTCSDSHGDQFTLRYRAGKWELRLLINAWGTRGIPCDEHPGGNQPWWTEHGAQAATVTAEILAKLMRN